MDSAPTPMNAPHPTSTRGEILDAIKRAGSATIPDLADDFGLSPETVRSHVKGLAAAGLVKQAGQRRDGPGRPQDLWRVTPHAETVFPRREGEFLRGLAGYLKERGETHLLERYLDQFAAERTEEGLARLEGLEGRARLERVAKILTEEGYMAEVVEDASDAAPRIRLCHCPVRELVHATALPCKAEIGFVKALVGDELARVEYMPDGDAACAYSIGSSDVEVEGPRGPAGGGDGA